MNIRKNKISRSDFLKTSGIVLGGIAILPNYSCSGNLMSDEKLKIEGRTDYTIVLPVKAGSIEKEAANQLQQYLSTISF